MFVSRRDHRFCAVPSIGILLVLVLAPVLEAQETDRMVFPRQVLEWYIGGEGDRVWELADESFRALAEDPEGMSEAGRELVSALGAQTAVLDEQMFAHPEGGGHQVYVRTASHAEAPEMFWIVIFSPAERRVLMIMPQFRQTIRSLFPEARLP
jgi:hypothetical protein